MGFFVTKLTLEKSVEVGRPQGNKIRRNLAGQASAR